MYKKLMKKLRKIFFNIVGRRKSITTFLLTFYLKMNFSSKEGTVVTAGRHFETVSFNYVLSQVNCQFTEESMWAFLELLQCSFCKLLQKISTVFQGTIEDTKWSYIESFMEYQLVTDSAVSGNSGNGITREVPKFRLMRYQCVLYAFIPRVNNGSLA